MATRCHNHRCATSDYLPTITSSMPNLYFYLSPVFFFTTCSYLFIPKFRFVFFSTISLKTTTLQSSSLRLLLFFRLISLWNNQKKNHLDNNWWKTTINNDRLLSKCYICFLFILHRHHRSFFWGLILPNSTKTD